MEKLAQATGMAEPALRLLVGVLVSYPLAFIYRFLPESAYTLKHLYNAICGLSIAWFCYGLEKGGILHSLLSIIITYIVLLLLRNNRQLGVVIAFVGNIGHLLAAYWNVATENYDIDFSTAQSVLTLRLIGLAWDFYDGSRPEKDLEKDQKENGLKNLPNPLELFGFCYFYPAFLIGPQFTFARYQKFITQELFKGSDKDSKLNAKNEIAWKDAGLRLLLGVIYLALYTAFSPYFPSNYLGKEEGLFYRMGYFWIVAYITVRKYLGIWLLGEGALIITGISFNGFDKEGKSQWNGLSNIKAYIFETSLTLHKLVEAFNVHTNDWVKRYVFKRLKFLGNRHISSFSALGFLAVWHGFAAGYFASFFMEFIGVDGEKNFIEALAPLNETLSRTVLKYPTVLVCWIIRTTMFHYGFIPFELKVLPSIWNFFVSTYFLYFIGVIGSHVLHALMASKPKKK